MSRSARHWLQIRSYLSTHITTSRFSDAALRPSEHAEMSPSHFFLHLRERPAKSPRLHIPPGPTSSGPIALCIVAQQTTKVQVVLPTQVHYHKCTTPHNGLRREECLLRREAKLERFRFRPPRRRWPSRKASKPPTGIQPCCTPRGKQFCCYQECLQCRFRPYSSLQAHLDMEGLHRLLVR